MIQDPQLEQIFRAESKDRLARLDRGLLDLEKSPGDRTLLDDLFRETHSLKGAARMLGLAQLEHTAHGMESLLNAALKAGAALSPEEVESLNAGLRKLRQEVDAALAPPAAAPPPPPGRPAEMAPAPAPIPEAAPAKPFQIGTVRVETDKLDDLLTLTGELGVLRGRTQHRQALMAQIHEQWSLVERNRRELQAVLRHTDGPLASLVEAGEGAVERLGDLLRTIRERLEEDAGRFDFALSGLRDRVQSARLLPLAEIFNLFPRMVRDLAKEQGKQIELATEGADITLDKRILEEIKDPLMHLLRNAVDHGIELPAERVRQGKPAAGRIRIAAVRDGPFVTLAIEDDGRGLDLGAIRRTAAERGLFDAATLEAMSPEELHQLVFAPGFSTAREVTELSGRGVGLDVVLANVEALKGTVRLHSVPGRGATAILRFPVSLTTLHLSVLRAGGRSFGLSLESIRSLRRLSREAFYILEGKTSVDIDGEPLLAPLLADLLELPAAAPADDGSGHVACAVIQVGDERLALQVDGVLDEEEVVPRALGPPLVRVRNVSSLAILASGEICPILNAADLLHSAARLRAVPRRDEEPKQGAPARPTVLLVEDSALVRAMEKRIIEDAGYQVVTAVDGADALDKLAGAAFAGVVSDIQMPNVNGLELAARIRQDERYRNLPIILVSALDSEEDKRRGLEVGANAYLPKATFDQRGLLEALKRVIGP